MRGLFIAPRKQWFLMSGIPPLGQQGRGRIGHWFRGQSFPGDADVVLVDSVVLGFHEPQVKTSGFLGAISGFL